MNLTQLNERLDQIQSEIKRFRNGRMAQFDKEIDDLRLLVAAFIGAPPKAAATPNEIIPWAELEKGAILHAVSVCRTPSAAADALGMGKTTLYRKLAEYKAAERAA